jgi:prepilin-type N-terminal cleavage/methylation domain-containing protein
MRPRPAQPRGFTLIELILVMTIIVILSAIAAPSMISFAAGRNNANTATLIVSLTGYARAQSVSEGRTYRLNVDPAKDVVWLTAGNAGVFTALSNDYGNQFPLATGTTMKTDMVARTDGSNGSNGGTYVEFNSNGRCEPAKIWLTDKYGRTIEVACDSPTELFRIVPPAEMTQ